MHGGLNYIHYTILTLLRLNLVFSRPVTSCIPGGPIGQQPWDKSRSAGALPAPIPCFHMPTLHFVQQQSVQKGMGNYRTPPPILWEKNACTVILFARRLKCWLPYYGILKPGDHNLVKEENLQSHSHRIYCPWKKKPGTIQYQVE